MLHPSLSVWQLFTVSVYDTKSNIFSQGGQLAASVLFKGLPVQRLTSTLCKSLSIQSRVHASCPEHANSRDVSENCLGDCSVDQRQSSARTLKIQQYSLHSSAQKLLNLLVWSKPEASSPPEVKQGEGMCSHQREARASPFENMHASQLFCLCASLSAQKSYVWLKCWEILGGPFYWIFFL